jgi:ribonuclease BN (tRNA processing enzyme)
MKLGKIGGIKMIYLSHLHADHSFGLPSFLLASNEEGRKRGITILGPTGLKEYIDELLKISYDKKLKDLKFGVDINEIGKKKMKEKEFLDYKFSFAPTRHSFECYSISIIDDKKKKITYTGDGHPTDELLELAKRSDLLISEAYGIGENHSSIITAAKLAKDSNSKLLALVHIFRKINIDKEMEMARKIFTPIIIPKEFDVVWI